MTDDRKGEDRRTETARDNDDSEMIDAIIDAPGQQGASGGDLQRDIGSQAEKKRVRDPDATEGLTKEDKIAQGERSERSGR